MQKWLTWLTRGCLMLCCYGCSLDYSFLFPPLDVVDSVDIERYTGTWYEIAKYPTWFQAGCIDAIAEYALQEDGTVQVVNTCQPVDGGELERIEGYAIVADSSTNAKLNVFFSNSPFGAPYWIIELGEDYEYAVVGEPSRSFLWILSRTPQIDEIVLQEILSRLPEKGYDPDRLEFSSSAMTSDDGS